MPWIILALIGLTLTSCGVVPVGALYALQAVAASTTIASNVFDIDVSIRQETAWKTPVRAVFVPTPTAVRAAIVPTPPAVGAPIYMNEFYEER